MIQLAQRCSDNGGLTVLLEDNSTECIAVFGSPYWLFLVDNNYFLSAIHCDRKISQYAADYSDVRRTQVCAVTQILFLYTTHFTGS